MSVTRKSRAQSVLVALLVSGLLVGCGGEEPDTTDVPLPGKGESPVVSIEPDPTQEADAKERPLFAADGTCSRPMKEFLSVYLGENTRWKDGFGDPSLLRGFKLGCQVVASRRSTDDSNTLLSAAVVRYQRGFWKGIGQRARGVGLTKDDMGSGVWLNSAGEPRLFVGELESDRGAMQREVGYAIADLEGWMIIKYYLD